MRTRMLRRALLATAILPLFVAATPVPGAVNPVPTAKPISAATAPKKTPAPKQEAKLDVACVQTALDKRDTAIIGAISTYSSSVTSALTTRKDALKAAWALTDGRKAAIKAAWDTSNKAVKAARATLNDARKAAWKTYGTDLKACKTSLSSDESSGQSGDAQL